MSIYDKQAAQTQGVSTIVAMPQWYINNNLANLLRNGTTSDGDLLQNVNLSDQSHGLWLHGKVSGMTVKACVPNSVSTVLFVLKFSSGTMDYWDVSTGVPVKSQCKIDGLQFGFAVNLSHQDVENDQNLPQDVRDAVSSMLQYLGPGSFSIEHLFMDLQNAALDQYDKTATVWSPNMPNSARAAFPQYLDGYLMDIANAGGNTLGYAISVDDTADLPATFPPTSLSYVTNQYRDGSAGNPDFDSVLYLMMTDGAAFPDNVQPWWGNLVVPSDKAAGRYGTMAMANRKYVHDFLVPTLGPITTPYWKLKNRNGGLDVDYDAAIGAFTPTALGGVFDSGHWSSRSHQTNAVSNDDADYGMQITVNFQVSPGKNLIVVSRVTTFDIHFTHWYGLEGAAASDDYHVWYSVPISYIIELTGAMDGKLQVNVTSQTNQKPPNLLSDMPYFWYITKQTGKASIWSNVADRLDTVVNNMVRLAMDEAILPNLASAIQERLNLNPFVFPGSAQLFISDPLFSDAGDLLLGLEYKV